jgi:hypothetical protein
MAEVNITPVKPEEDQAHIDAMVAKAAQGVGPAGAPQGDPAAKPEWLGDFDSPEEMAKAYAELRSKMSKDGAPKPEDKPSETPSPDEATREQAAEATKKAGVDLAALESEFTESGALSEATYAKLAEAGFDKTTVDTYIAGQQALNEQFRNRIAEHVGGSERLNSALEWATTNLSPIEAKAFNSVVDTADEAGLKLALDGLMAKFDADGGAEPTLLGGNVNRNSGSIFRSTAELTAAMGDPRYARDPAYRADVEQRLARSSIF